MYYLALHAWCPAQFLICRRSPHQRTISLNWQVILRSTLLTWISYVWPFNFLPLPSFQRKTFMLPLFPQSCFEEEVLLTLSNVHFKSSALDLTQFHFSCTLLRELLLLYLPRFVSFSYLTFPHGLQMGSLSPTKMKQLQLSQPFHDHPVYGSFPPPYLPGPLPLILHCFLIALMKIMLFLLLLLTHVFLSSLECKLYEG